jgi:uncharacterized protein (TIGR00290 family)
VPEPIVLSWSGGKDSALALHALRADPAVDVVALLTTVTEKYERISIHGVRRELLRAQGESLGLPVHEMLIGPGATNESYEAALGVALAALQARYPLVKRIAFGDLFLDDVRRYREERLAAHGLTGHFPLWGAPTDALARRFIELRFAARLVCVDTTLLDLAFAGRPFDAGLLAALPPQIDPCGERGEFHTFVSDGPGFSWPVAYAVGSVVIREARFAYCDLLPRGRVRSAHGPSA